MRSFLRLRSHDFIHRSSAFLGVLQSFWLDARRRSAGFRQTSVHSKQFVCATSVPQSDLLSLWFHSRRGARRSRRRLAINENTTQNTRVPQLVSSGLRFHASDDGTGGSGSSSRPVVHELRPLVALRKLASFQLDAGNRPRRVVTFVTSDVHDETHLTVSTAQEVLARVARGRAHRRSRRLVSDVLALVEPHRHVTAVLSLDGDSVPVRRPGRRPRRHMPTRVVLLPVVGAAAATAQVVGCQSVFDRRHCANAVAVGWPSTRIVC